MYSPPTVPPVMKIEVLSHGFVVTEFDGRGKVAITDFARNMAEYGLVRVGRNQFERKVERVFAAYTADRKEWRFHRNQLQDFINHVSGYGWSENQIQISVRESYVPAACEHRLKEGFVPRDIQVPLIEYIAGPCPEPFAPSKVVTLQTGRGKTLTTLFAISKLATRVVVVLPGMYVDQWAKEVNETFEYEFGDLIVIRGTKPFTQMLNAALDDTLTAKFIIITTNTWQKYMQIHETSNCNSELVYPVPPDRFYETIKAGIRNIDEVHLNFHCNFRQDLFTHITLTNSLSATLEPEKPMLAKLYDIVWPAETRGPEVEYDKFISMAVLWYSISDVQRIRCIGPRGYSHNDFEKSILRYKGMTKDYFEMHLSIITREFISVFEPGQSALVMFSTIDMAVKFHEFLTQRLPDLNIQRYVRGMDDDYHENFRKGDIIISTYKSSGTAVDRPNLRVTFRSMWLSTKEGNIQVLGRTRRLKDWPDVAPRFICISAREIPKHREYTKAIFQKLGGKVLVAHEMQTSFRI